MDQVLIKGCRKTLGNRETILRRNFLILNVLILDNENEYFNSINIKYEKQLKIVIL